MGERLARENISEWMAAAARDLEDQQDPEETYRMAVSLALTHIPGCEVAGLAIARRRGQVESHAPSDPSVVLADQLQQELKEGPVLDALWDRTTVYSPSLAYDDRWPVWGPRVVEETGLQSALSFQLFTHGDILGVLNLFGRPKDAFGEEDRLDGLALAAHMAIAVTAVHKINHLSSALASRTLLGQATGIVMERYQISADRAFAVLARIASTTETKVRDVAQALVTEGTLPDLKTPAAPDDRG